METNVLNSHTILLYLFIHIHAHTMSFSLKTLKIRLGAFQKMCNIKFRSTTIVCMSLENESNLKVENDNVKMCVSKRSSIAIECIDYRLIGSRDIKLQGLLFKLLIRKDEILFNFLDCYQRPQEREKTSAQIEHCHTHPSKVGLDLNRFVFLVCRIENEKKTSFKYRHHHHHLVTRYLVMALNFKADFTFNFSYAARSSLSLSHTLSSPFF